MSTVKAAFKSIEKKIKDKTIKSIKPKSQSKIFEIRYSKRKEFDIKAVNNFFKKKKLIYLKKKTLMI